MRPSVSVLTTVYNGSAYVGETIESVLAQTDGDLEHVVVDDGSTDETPSILASFGDPRVRLIRIDRSGRGRALNAGIEACRGEYVAILDADDVSARYRISLQRRLLEADETIDVLGGTCALVRSAIDIPEPFPAPPVAISPRVLAKRTPIAHSAAMIRRSALERLGGYDEARRALFDFDLWVRMAQAGSRMCRVEAPVVYKRIHRDQSFERRNRLAYLRATLRERRRAARLFGESPLDSLYPLAGFAFGLIPTDIRMRLFRLSGE